MLKQGREGQIQSVGPGHDLRSDQCILSTQNFRKDLFQLVSSGIIITVAIDVAEVGI